MVGLVGGRHCYLLLALLSLFPYHYIHSDHGHRLMKLPCESRTDLMMSDPTYMHQVPLSPFQRHLSLFCLRFSGRHSDTGYVYLAAFLEIGYLRNIAMHLLLVTNIKVMLRHRATIWRGSYRVGVSQGAQREGGCGGYRSLSQTCQPPNNFWDVG